MDNQQVKMAAKRLESLRQQRSGFMSDWRDISDFVLGVQSRFLQSESQNSTDCGSSNRSARNDSLYNETAKFAAQTLASGMMAGITSPARPWFNLVTPDPDMMDYGPAKTWLSQVEKILYMIFARSNFYKAMHTSYLNLGIFGNSCYGIYEDYKTIARFDTFPVGQYFLALNGKSEVDTMYREYSISVRAAVTIFGLDAMSSKVRQYYSNGHYEYNIDIVHVIEPNDNILYGSPLSKDLPWRSFYYEKSDNNKHLIKDSGFNEKAFVSPRWNAFGDDAYSTIYPGIDSLGTNKALQVNELDEAIAIEKQHNPPLVADSGIAREGTDLIAGGITYAPGMSAGGKPGIAPVYQVNPDINGLELTMGKKEQRIQRHFYADLFMMITELDSVRSATEIAERKEEKLLMLGPVLESVNNEMLDPTIDRVFAMAQRAGILPPPPQELDNVDLKVEYVSILAQAQRAISTASMESTAAFAMQLAQIDPTAFDKIDSDQMIDEHAKAKGAPPSTIRSDDDVLAIREARAEQEAMQMAQAEAAEMAATAETLSKTDTGGDNLLSEMVGG